MLWQMAEFHFSLRLTFHYIYASVCVPVYICIYVYTTHTHTCIFFFIHSCVDGRWGCFHIFVIVDDAPMNARVRVSFQISVFTFFRHPPRSKTAGSYGSYIFSFWGTTCCFPQGVHQCTLPPTVREGSLFSTASPTFAICGLFDGGLSDRCEVITLWFWLAFLWWLAMLNIFSCACWPSPCYLWENVYSGLQLIF